MRTAQHASYMGFTREGNGRIPLSFKILKTRASLLSTGNNNCGLTTALASGPTSRLLGSMPPSLCVFLKLRC